METKFLGEMYYGKNGIKITQEGLVRTWSFDSMASSDFQITLKDPEEENSNDDVNSMISDFRAVDFLGDKLVAEKDDELIHIDIRFKNKYFISGVVLCRNFWVYGPKPGTEIIDPHEYVRVGVNLSFLTY